MCTKLNSLCHFDDIRTAIIHPFLIRFSKFKIVLLDLLSFYHLRSINQKKVLKGTFKKAKVLTELTQ